MSKTKSSPLRLMRQAPAPGLATALPLTLDADVDARLSVAIVVPDPYRSALSQQQLRGFSGLVLSEADRDRGPVLLPHRYERGISHRTRPCSSTLPAACRE